MKISSTKFVYLLLVISCVILKTTCFAPVPFAVGSGLLTSGVAFLAKMLHIDCWFVECCDKHWVPGDMERLRRSLQDEVYGQHIANDVILKQLISHITDPKPAKALVMSFHGWTGGGKNLVASLVANSTYLKGMESQFVHHFMATVDFPHPELSKTYGDQLRNWVKGNVSLCPVSLFVFDEMDKMPAGVFDGIRSYLDYNEVVHGVDFRRSIFIILSNTGGRNITEKMLQSWNDGIKREDLTYKDFENLILLGAFNEQGGLHKSTVIERSLIDLYVPFLPLEKRHVRLCAKREFQRRGYSPNDEDLKAIADSVDYFPANDEKTRSVELFSKSGCKKVAAIVGRHLAQLKYGKLFD